MSDANLSQDRLNALLRLTRAWRLEWNVNRLLGRVACEAAELLGFERGVVFLLERDGLVERARFPESIADERFHASSLQLAQRVVHNGRALHVHASDSEGADAVCVPLTASRGILGALYVDAPPRKKALLRSDYEFVDLLGLQAANALEHAILYYSAITDPLTGLFTHRHFQQEVEQSLRRSERTESPVSLILLDLDHFKELNDTAGHEAGNQCLVAVASLLRSSLRSSDIIARFGGDEFEIMLADADAAIAFNVGEKIRRQIGDLELAQRCRVQGTMGVASYPANAPDAHSLFLQADAALYQAKEAGRNRTICSTAKGAERRKPADSEYSAVKAAQEMAGALTPASRTEPSQKALIAPPAGTEVAHRIDGHTVVRRLGSGSAGEVFLVRQPDLDREVALKRPLTPHLTADQEKAFETEAKITAALEHPGVTTVHMMGRDVDGRRYYTMKPLHGKTLAELFEIRRKRDIAIAREYGERRMLEILQRVSETVAYAHERQVAHLDITPSNIVVGEFGEVTLIDWGRGSYSGQASPTTAMQDSGGETAAKRAFVFGSLGYTAPEQLPESKDVPGPATDIYALGAILYEILTGSPPHLQGTSPDAVEAIRSGTVIRPEVVVPDRGLDPVICNLCMTALEREPARRPSARDFATRLGRLVRRDPEWETVKFGPAHTPLQADEWTALYGKFELHDGEFVSAARGESIMMWEHSVVGPFRFACEVWHETGGELSIIGQGPAPRSMFSWDRRSQYDGYCFQFGAENNICTKLARNGADILGQYGLVVEPGRKYLLEMELIDGWLYCSIDGQRIFDYRELFPMRGSNIGLYAFDFGAHFRPLEVHWLGGALQVPAIQTADDLYQSGEYRRAAERYHDIATRFPHRLEGVEARLKLGSCFGALKEYNEAHRIFHSLEGTILEPFALLEDARLSIDDPDEDPWRCVELYRNALARFPERVKTALPEIVILKRNRMRGDPSRFETLLPLAQDLEIRHEMARMARDASQTVLQSQITCAHIAIQQALQLGKHEQALAEMLEFDRRLIQAQRDKLLEQYIRLIAVLACGREDLLPSPPYQALAAMGPSLGTWCTGLALHVLVRKGKVDEFLNTVPDPFPAHLQKGIYGHTLALLRFCQRKPELAIDIVRTWIMPFMQPQVRRPLWLFRWAAGALVESQSPAAREFLDEFITHSQAAIDETDSRFVPAFVRGRWALEHCDFEEAEKHTRELPTVSDRHLVSPFLLHIFLHSLGLHTSSSSDDLHRRLSCMAAGAEYELGNIMLGRQEPRISETWPHPLWRPEWRLWLALWLEAKGQPQAAVDIILPARDPRYGMTHCQPAIEQLLQRIQTRSLLPKPN
ncbi:MAG TPA: diguanylate cyclase [Planctomycetota bacterium]|nr:diguanylate cyclase [Planctomycetota bacterium]